MGLALVHHSNPDPGSMYHTRATHLFVKVAVSAIQITDRTMGASAQVLIKKASKDVTNRRATWQHRRHSNKIAP